MTPPELSPAKPYGDWKFDASYDFGPRYQPHSNNALLFETEPQTRHQDIPGGGPYRPSIPQSADPFRPSGRAFPAFEPFSESSPYPSAESFARLDNPTLPRQDPTMLHPSWNHQRLRTSSSSADWMKVEERRGFEPSGISELHSSPSHPSHSARSHAAAHEVGCVRLVQHLVRADTLLTAYQLPYALTSFFQPPLPSLRLAHNQIVGSASLYLPSAEA